VTRRGTSGQTPKAPPAAPWSPRTVQLVVSRFWRGTLEGAFYVLVALLVIWPVTLHLTSRIVGTGDGEFYLWLGWRLGELIQSGSLPIRIPDAVYPTGYNVALGDGYAADLVIALWNLVAGPFLAINLTVLMALTLNFLGGRRLGRIVAPQSRVIWILTALAFGTAPQILLRAYGHYHLLFAFVAALVLAEAILYVRDELPLRLVRLGLLLALAFALSIYWFATSLAVLVVVSVCAGVARKQLLQVAGRIAGAVAIMLVLTAPLTIPRLAFDHREQAAAGDRSLQAIDNENNSVRFAADALSIIAQPGASRITLPGAGRLHRDFFPNRLEATIFPGLLLLASLFLFAFTRSRLRVPLLSAALVLWVLALGPTLLVDGSAVLTHDDGSPVRFMPEELLYAFPGTSALRAPSRLAFALPALGAVAFAVLAAAARARMTRTWQRVAATAGVLGLIATNLVVLPYTSRSLPAPLQSALETIRATSRAGDTVMEVPFDAAGQYIQTIRFQMVHRRPTLGFHAQHSALPWYSDFDRYKRSAALAEVRCFPPLIGYAPAPYDRELRPTGHELADLRRQFRLRFLLVNDTLLATPLCNDRRKDIEAILRSARLMVRSGGWRVFEVQ
jgi:hypothetical protein